MGVILALISFACTSREVKEKLAVSEDIMMSQPDSALTLIESIDPKQLHTDKDKALYGLLYTMATLKNNLPLKNDTIINYSVKYFEKKFDKKHLAISLCYQGAALYNSGLTYKALMSYLHALDAAEEIDNKFYTGLACRGIADIYSESFNSGDELVYAKREFENFKAAGIQPYLNYSMLDLSRAFHNNAIYKEVYKLSEQIKDSAINYNDSYLYSEAISSLANAYLAEKRTKEAIEIYKSMVDDSIASNKDLLLFSMSYALNGDNSKSLEIMNNINQIDSLTKESILCCIKKNERNYEEALRHSDIVDSLTNNILQRKFAKEFSAVISDNYSKSAEQSRHELKTTQNILWLTITLCLMTVITLAGIAYLLIKKHLNEISEKVMIAEQLKSELIQSKEANNQSVLTIKNLLSTRYELLEELCTVVIQNNDTRTARKKIADKVTNLIEDLSIDGNKLKDFGKEIDIMYNNLFSDFKIALPDLKEADYALYILYVKKISPSIISLFLKEKKLSAIYERKRRLKTKILQLEEPSKSRYLKHLM